MRKHNLFDSLVQNDVTFLLPVYQGCPGKEAIKWVFVLFSMSVA